MAETKPSDDDQQQQQQQQQQKVAHAASSDEALTPRGSGARAVRMLKSSQEPVHTNEDTAAEQQKAALELGLSEWQVEQRKKTNQWREDEISRHVEALATLPDSTPRNSDSDDEEHMHDRPTAAALAMAASKKTNAHGGGLNSETVLKNVRYATFHDAYKAVGGRPILNQYRYVSQDFESFIPEVDLEEVTQPAMFRCFGLGTLLHRTIDVFPSFMAVVGAIKAAFAGVEDVIGEENTLTKRSNDPSSAKVQHRVVDVRHVTEAEKLKERAYNSHDGDFVRFLGSVSATFVFPTLKGLYEGLSIVGTLPLLQSHLYRVIFFHDSHQDDLNSTGEFRKIRILLSVEGHVCETVLVTEPMYEANKFQIREQRQEIYRRLFAQVVDDDIAGASKTLASPYLNSRTIVRRTASSSALGGGASGKLDQFSKDDDVLQKVEMPRCLRTKAGLSMLHVAVLRGSHGMVQLLLRHGFDALEAHCGTLAFELAVVHRQWDIARTIFVSMAPALLTLTEEDADDFEAVVVVDGLGDLDLGSGAPNSLDAESKTETMDNVDNVDVIEQKMDTAAIEQMLQAFTAHSGSLESIHRCIQIVFEMSFASALRSAAKTDAAGAHGRSRANSGSSPRLSPRLSPRNTELNLLGGRKMTRTWSQLSGLSLGADDIPEDVAGALVDLVLALDEHSPRTIWHDWATNRSVLTAMRFISERSDQVLGRKLLQLLPRLDDKGRTALDIAAHKNVDAENVVSFLLRIGSRLSALHKTNIGSRSAPRLNSFYDTALLTVARSVRQKVYSDHESSLEMCQVIKDCLATLAKAIPEAQRVLPSDNATIRDALLLQNQLPRCRETVRPIMEEGPAREGCDLSPHAAICDGMAISVLALWWKKVCPRMLAVTLNGCHRLSDEDLEVLAPALPRLKMLTLKGCVGIGDRGVRAIARRCFGLVNLDLSGCSAVANDALAALGGGCPRLVELYLSGCSGITTEGVKELAGGCQELEALHLADCENLDDEGLRAVGAGLPRLKTLNLAGCICISDSGMQACLEGCTKLRKLVLRGCDKLTDRSIIDVSKYLPHLVSLDVSACDRVTNVGLAPLGHGNCVELRELFLSGCEKITDKVLVELGRDSLSADATAPEEFEKTQKVDMFSETDERWFPGKVVSVLRNRPANAIEPLPGAMRVDGFDKGPWYNVILDDGEGVNGVNHMHLRVHRVGCRALETLNISGCALIRDAGLQALAKGCPSLRTLDLSYCTGVGSQGMIALATYCKGIRSIGLDSCEKLTSNCLVQFASSSPDLRSVNFFDCKHVDDAVLKALGAGCPSLTDLDLSGCVRIGHEGLGALSAGCKVLRTLDLSNCKNVDDDAMKALHGELANLEILTLSGCRRITGTGIQFLAPKVPRLKSLSLKFCLKVEDSALEALGQHCVGLQSLELANCTRLTDEGVKWLARGCCRLESLDLSFCKNVTAVSMRWLCGSINGVDGCDNLRVIRLVEAGVDDAGKVNLHHRFQHLEVID